jgi:hypothetical protein
MNTQLTLSILVSVFSLGLVLIGIPAQIKKNYQEKRSGQPLTTILIALGFYASSIGFFTLTRSWFPLASFSVGIVMWGITLIQYWLYEIKREHNKAPN